MSTDSDTGPEGEPVRLLPTDQRDMTPSAVLWAKVVLKGVTDCRGVDIGRRR
jgi:hypothetical protein